MIISASGMFGVINETLFNNFFFNISVEFLSINLAPPFATITGSKTILLTFIFSNELETELITFLECSMPILIAFG